MSSRCLLLQSVLTLLATEMECPNQAGILIPSPGYPIIRDLVTGLNSYPVRRWLLLFWIINFTLLRQRRYYIDLLNEVYIFTRNFIRCALFPTPLVALNGCLASMCTSELCKKDLIQLQFYNCHISYCIILGYNPQRTYIDLQWTPVVAFERLT